MNKNKKTVEFIATWEANHRDVAAWLQRAFPAGDSTQAVQDKVVKLVKQQPNLRGRLVVVGANLAALSTNSACAVSPAAECDGTNVDGFRGFAIALPKDPARYITLVVDTEQVALFGDKTPPIQLNVDITSLGGFRLRVDVTPREADTPTEFLTRKWKLSDKDLGHTIGRAPRPNGAPNRNRRQPRRAQRPLNA